MRLISAIDRASLAGREDDEDDEEEDDEASNENDDEEGALNDGRRASGDMARVMAGFASDSDADEDEASSDDDDLLASNGLPLSVRNESLRVSVPPPPPPAAAALLTPLPPVFWRESIGGPPAPGAKMSQ